MFKAKLPELHHICEKEELGLDGIDLDQHGAKKDQQLVNEPSIQTAVTNQPTDQANAPEITLLSVTSGQ